MHAIQLSPWAGTCARCRRGGVERVEGWEGSLPCQRGKGEEKTCVSKLLYAECPQCCRDMHRIAQTSSKGTLGTQEVRNHRSPPSTDDGTTSV